MLSAISARFPYANCNDCVRSTCVCMQNILILCYVTNSSQPQNVPRLKTAPGLGDDQLPNMGRVSANALE